MNKAWVLCCKKLRTHARKILITQTECQIALTHGQIDFWERYTESNFSTISAQRAHESFAFSRSRIRAENLLKSIYICWLRCIWSPRHASLKACGTKLNLRRSKIIIPQRGYCCDYRGRRMISLCAQHTAIPIKWCHSVFLLYDYTARCHDRF